MHTNPRAARPLAAVLTATALALAGCGGGGGGGTAKASHNSTPTATSTPSAGTAGALKLTADKTQLKFDKTSLSAKHGTVTIAMTNPSATPHNVAIEGHGVDVTGKVVQQGGTSTVTAKLKPGTYTFYCSVDSHRQAGMEGKLTVR
jgi:plastocyanin